MTESNAWRKSSFSGQGGECIELHRDGAVRDSKNPTGPAITLDWHQLVAAAKAAK